jgi:hypothetical protein
MVDVRDATRGLRTALPMVAAVGWLVGLVGVGSAEDPDWHVRTDTWADSLVTSSEALSEREEAEDQPEVYRQLAVRVASGGEPAQRLSVPVSGLSELHLFVAGTPGIPWGAATWADAKLTAKDGREEWLCHAESLKIIDGRHSVGTDSPLAYGDPDTDFAIHANMADYTIRDLAYEGWRPKARGLEHEAIGDGIAADVAAA